MPDIIMESAPSTADLLGDRALLSKKEVVALVGVTYPSIWNWMREGRFPRSVHCGGRTFWRRDEIIRWIDELPQRPLKGDKAA